jgi:hypothetical protein
VERGHASAARHRRVPGADPEKNLTGGRTFDWGPSFYEIAEFKHFSFIICTNTK